MLKSSQQKNTQLSNSGELVYKQKKQTAKTLQDKNKSGSKCSNVLENLKTKTDIKDSTKSFAKKQFDTHINGETQPQNSEVNKLINDATNSIIEKTCPDEVDSKRRKLDETAADNSIQKGHDTITNGNTQSKYIYHQHYRLITNCLTSYKNNQWPFSFKRVDFCFHMNGDHVFSCKFMIHFMFTDTTSYVLHDVYFVCKFCI